MEIEPGSANPDLKRRDRGESERPVDGFSVGCRLQPHRLGAMGPGDVERRHGEPSTDTEPAMGRPHRGADHRSHRSVEVNGDRTDHGCLPPCPGNDEHRIMVGEHGVGNQTRGGGGVEPEGFALHLDDLVAVPTDGQLEVDGSAGRRPVDGDDGSHHARSAHHHLETAFDEHLLDRGVVTSSQVERRTPTGSLEQHFGSNHRCLRIVHRSLYQRDVLGLVPDAAQHHQEAAKVVQGATGDPPGLAGPAGDQSALDQFDPRRVVHSDHDGIRAEQLSDLADQPTFGIDGELVGEPDDGALAQVEEHL